MFAKRYFAVGVSVPLLIIIVAVGRSENPAQRLLKDLACGACHPGLPKANGIHLRSPNLADAGLRYNPAYLFEYLQNPTTRVREHLGATRMPSFHFSAEESVALVAFLQSQTVVEGEWPDYPPEASQPIDFKVDGARAKTLMLDSLDCGKCHVLQGQGEARSVDLATVGYRLNAIWIKKYLVAPYIFDGPNTTMPSYFYNLAATRNRFDESMPAAGQAIDAITRYLFAIAKEKRAQLQAAYDRARAEYPNATADLGERIFLSQNCSACHRNSAVTAWRPQNAPDLSFEGARVRKEWLQSYLRKPTPIRPFGFYPGSGSRMPDFRLTDDETRLVSDYLEKKSYRSSAAWPALKSAALSAFSRAKAKTLLREKLSCLGCHQLGDEGGKIGPNLSSLNQRLKTSFVYQFIRDPRATMPESTMPKIMMPNKTLDLIVNYLVQQEEPKAEASYLPLAKTPVHLYSDGYDGASLYAKYCSTCHGSNGGGNGYNAASLPAAPASHIDAAAMARRPDDTLFDGIFAGGAILNKSHLMPPWGHSLTTKDIRMLVAYMRELCECEGPPWSRDHSQSF